MPATSETAATVHASAISAGGRAALIRGPSGSGKSDLVLRCLTLNATAFTPAPILLLADDQVALNRTGSILRAQAPVTLRGLLEVRGAGLIAPLQVAEAAEVVLAVDLTGPQDEAGERLPDPWPTADMLGVCVPLLRLRAFEASAAAKLVAALTRADLPRTRLAT